MSRQAASHTHQTPAAAPQIADGLLQRKCDCGQHLIAGGDCSECSKNQMSLQRSARNSEPETRNSDGAPSIVHEVLRSAGHPLDAQTRAFMEPRFSHDFSLVRVHTDARAAESALAVNALAYTVGRDVVFGTSGYQPGTIAGKRLLAHELAHTVQQANGFQPKLAINQPRDQFEQEADRAAAAISEGAPSPFYGHSRSATTSQLMKQEVPDKTIKTPLKSSKGGARGGHEGVYGPYLLPEVVITATKTYPQPAVPQVLQTSEALGKFSVRDVTFIQVEEVEDIDQRMRRLNRQAEEEFQETIRRIQQQPPATISDASPEAALKIKQAENRKAQEELKRVFGDGWGTFFWWTRGGGQTGEGSPVWEVINSVRVWNRAYPPQAYPSAPRIFRPATLPDIPKTEWVHPGTK